VLASFYRKSELLPRAGAPAVQLSMQRLPRQPALSTRLPFGTAPQGVQAKALTGVTKAEREQELPPRPLPGEQSALDPSLLSLSTAGVPLVRCPVSGDRDGVLQSLSLCAALRVTPGAMASQRHAFAAKAKELLSGAALSKLVARKRPAVTAAEALAAAAREWRFDVRVYTEADDGRLRHSRFVSAVQCPAFGLPR
jgi:hypothetical protein